MQSLSLRPHAKINLGLRILAKRPDGYHDLRTRFQTIDLVDELEIERTASGIRLRVEGAPLAEDSSNLVRRAAEALRQGRRGLPGASLFLRKRIPMAAGLGGGSSDAAATLMGLVRLWGLEISGEELRKTAASLGADVPFFLVGGCARGAGRGDEITPLPDPPPFRIVLLLPSLVSSTEQAFRLWDAGGPFTAARRAEAGPQQPVADDPADLFSGRSVGNDFEPLLFALHPELQVLKDRLIRHGARAAALSGSGPSLYGIFADEREVRRVQADPAWGKLRVVGALPVGRADYHARLGLTLSD